jgi:VCBS repeat-containing protein
MRAPMSLPLTDELLVLAQSGRSLVITKPPAGQPGILQIAPGETLDFSRIANESLALVKLGNRLVVLFPDRAYVVVDGLYLPDGSFTPQVRVALDSATTVDTAQFTNQFGVSSDEGLLTAAGISVGPRGAGGVNMAAAPPSSALNPESSLTPDISGPSSTFGALTADDAGTTTQDDAGAATTGLGAPPSSAADTGAVTEAGVGPGNAAVLGVPTASGNVLTNDTGSSNLTVTGVAAGAVAAAAGNVGTAVAGQFGTLTIAAGGAYSYALDNAAAATQALAQGTTATDTFTYTVTDANGRTATTTVTVTVNGTNDAPVITSGAAAAAGTVTETETGTNLGVPVPGVATATGALTASDVDSGAVLTWSGNATGAFGSFAIDPATGVWTYTINEAAAEALNSGQAVTETFTATVTDQFGATATQTVSVTVNGANDTGPVVVPQTFGLDLDTLAAGTGYRGVTDAEAARSQLAAGVPERFTNLGVSVAQTDETSALDPRPNNIAVNLVDPGDRVVSITVALDAVTSGNAGVLRLSDGYQTLPAGTVTIDDANRVLQIVFATGYTAAEAVAVLSTLRFVNTDTSFFMDSSNRTVTITITDQNGNAASAIASVPVAADVTDGLGAAGVNLFTGGANSDRIIGLDGDDVLDGGSGGNDVIDGGADDDTIIAANGNNTLLGGTGDNTITAGNGNNVVTAADGDNTVTLGNGVNQVTLGNGDNTVTAGDGGNTITTGNGDDVVTTGSGDDIINAGDGSNRITSGGGNDTITTGIGDDVINSGAGNDRIIAGRGDDDITTGSGSDTIVYNSNLAQIGFDTLRDFESGVDTLEFSLATVGGGLATGGADTGVLDASRFTTGGAFTTVDQRFRFDTATNILFFDADGSNAGQAEIALALVETGTFVAADVRIA